MQSDHVLVFDIEGEYGHFRKFNTTTSPLSYPIPPRTTIIGIIGAVLGIERETGAGRYREGQQPLAGLLAPGDAQIAVQLLKPVSKVNMAFNLVNTKNSFFNIDNRTQIEYELLKRPKFRIFLQWNNEELRAKLHQSLATQQTHFTVTLGLSQMIAQVSYVGQFATHRVTNGKFQPVLSAVKLSLLDTADPIDFNDQFKYLLDTYPNVMTPGRLVTEFAEILVEANGNPIDVKSDYVYAIETLGNILFL